MNNTKYNTYEEQLSSYGDFISYANNNGIQKILESEKDVLQKFAYKSRESCALGKLLCQCLLGTDLGYQILLVVKRVNPELVSVSITSENRIIRNDNFIILEDSDFVVALQPREKELFFLLAKKK